MACQQLKLDGLVEVDLLELVLLVVEDVRHCDGCALEGRLLLLPPALKKDFGQGQAMKQPGLVAATHKWSSKCSPRFGKQVQYTYAAY